MAAPGGIEQRLRRPLAIFVAAHGFAHFVGTASLFGKAWDGETAHLLGGAWQVSGAASLYLLGVLWAGAAVAYMYAAAVIWLDAGRWPLMLLGVTLASLVLVVFSLWASVVGLGVDLALLVVARRAWPYERFHLHAW